MHILKRLGIQIFSNIVFERYWRRRGEVVSRREEKVKNRGKGMWKWGVELELEGKGR